MLSIQELFYSEYEEIYIVKPEKQPDKEKGGEKKEPDKPPVPTPVEEAFGKYYPYSFRPWPPAPPPKPEQPKGPAPPKKVEMKVVADCFECIDLIARTLEDMKGVKKGSVKIDRVTGKATVELTTATPDTVLLETRRVYKKARLWTKEDG